MKKFNIPGISKFDFNVLSKYIIPYLYKLKVDDYEKYYKNIYDFLKPEASSSTGYMYGMYLADYLTYWSNRWEKPGYFENIFSNFYEISLKEKFGIYYFDIKWIEEYFLPFLKDKVKPSDIEKHGHISNFLTSAGMQSMGYAIGMNIATYLEYWDKRRSDINPPFTKRFNQKYNEGLILIIKESLHSNGEFEKYEFFNKINHLFDVICVFAHKIKQEIPIQNKINNMSIVDKLNYLFNVINILNDEVMSNEEFENLDGSILKLNYIYDMINYL